MNSNHCLDSHFPELDGIRGMAITLVLIFHCMPLNSLPMSDFIAPIKASCWIGVDLFFVLSGFLITRILIGLKQTQKKYLIFYGRRSLRIFPLYYFTLTVVFFLLIKNADIHYTIQYCAPMKWFFLYAYNIYIWINNSWAISDYLNHFWSLCVEEQFYLFWPLIIFTFQSARLPFVMTAIITAAISFKTCLFFIGMTAPVLFTNMFARMDCFAFGGLAAYAHLYWDKAIITKKARFLFFLSFSILMLTGIIEKGIHAASPLILVVMTPIIALFFSCLIYLSLNDGIIPVKRFLSNNILRLLGKYSYGIYIYHWIIFVSIIRFDVLSLHIENPWLQFITVLLATFSVSFLSFHLLEQHFLKAKKYFTFQIKPERHKTVCQAR
ncbi:MAG: acyltransferase family protein [Thermodesulfobacteriota bacterium]